MNSKAQNVDPVIKDPCLHQEEDMAQGFWSLSVASRQVLPFSACRYQSSLDDPGVIILPKSQAGTSELNQAGQRNDLERRERFYKTF